MADGGVMDHFSGLSVTGIPARRMAVVWTILWSFCNCDGCSGRWRWHGQLSGLSVTVRYAVADGGGISHFLVFSVTVMSATADGNSMDDFWCFCHCEVCCSGRQWQGPFSGLLSPWGLPWWMAVVWDIFRSFCHCEVLPQPKVTACTTFWSLLSPRGPSTADGDRMPHYRAISITARSSSNPW